MFACARVGLGALGVVTKVTLQCEPSFRLHSIEKPRSLDSLVDDLDDIVDHNEHIDCYWFPHTDVATVKVANRTDEPLRTQVVVEGVARRHPARQLRVRCRRRPRTATPGCGPEAHAPRRRRDRQDRGRRREPPRALQPAARAFRRDGVRDPAARARQGAARACATSSRARACRSTSRSSSGWPRPTTSRSARRSGRETCYLAVHLSAGTPFERYFRGVEAIMDDFGGRPHWGKMHYQRAETLAPRYPEWDALPGRPRPPRPGGSVPEPVPRSGARPRRVAVRSAAAHACTRAPINEGETVALDLHPHWWFFSKHILTGIPLLLALIGVLTLSGSVQAVAGWAWAIARGHLGGVARDQVPPVAVHALRGDRRPRDLPHRACSRSTASRSRSSGSTTSTSTSASSSG